MFVDTHAHLYLKEFDEDIDQVVKDALQAGVEHILLPNISAAYIDPLKALTARYPFVFSPMMGLHPGSVGADFEKELEMVREELITGDYIAVGEIGTDLYWDVTYKDQQIHAFEEQINWAKELGLPVVIHARNSMELTIDTVARLHDDRLTGVFHCFTGTLKEAERIIELGFYLGIGGVSTYRNGGLNDLLATVSLEKILLETDAPYLPPVPFRGKRNESRYIEIIARHISSVRKCSMEEVGMFTTANAHKLFRISAFKNQEKPGPENEQVVG